VSAATFDPFEVLGISRGATKEQVRAAYRELAVRYHPDKHRGNPLEELAAAKLVEINRAYEILSDDAQRTAYEAGGRSAPSAAASAVSEPVTRSSMPEPLAKVLRSVGTILTLLFVLRFGLGIASKLLLLLRGLLYGLLSLMRMGPVFAITIVLVITMGGSYLLRARKNR
jgi:hypothetical protein